MDFLGRASSHALLVFCSFIPAYPAIAQAPEEATDVDREYVLEAWIVGYKGMGGDIEGLRNPVLKAVEGEVIRITLVNGEPLVHDLKMEKLGVKTPEVLEVGERASITFTAKESDTYFCTIADHRAAGMEGRFEVFEDEITAPVAESPTKNGESLNLDFETGTLRPRRKMSGSPAVLNAGGSVA